ncbi:MAG TPA: kelch repeat-containing protein [Steroidobacteraceae bacterium]
MPNSSLHTVGGAINGLTGSGLVLVNGADHVTIAADATAFTFPTSVAQAASYAVTVQSVPAGLHCSVVNGTGTVATTDVTNVLVACAAQLFSVGGTVSGLSGTGLVLANGADQLTVVAGATTFTLANPVSYSNSYAVTVQSAPAGLTCSVANATGIMGTANVNNVVVTCSDLSYALGGTISGLNGAGLVLANGTDHLTVAAGATTFALGAVAFSSSYAVTVDTQPSGVTCSVTGGMGTMSAGDVTNVAVTCSDQPYSLGGTIAGLDATGLVLANGSDQLTVSLGANSFMLPTPVAFASSYAVTVMTQPTGLTCTVSAGSGAMPAANVSSVSVVCAHQSYTLSGAISGLNGTGLVLANGADRLSVASGAAAFTLPASVAFGSSYAVTVATQPAGVSCTVSSGSGTMPAMNVTSVDVVCSDQTFTLGGTIIGLTASGLVLTDGTDWVSVAANAGVFSMPTGVAYQSHYQVTVVAQPAAGLNCTVTGGSGTMPATDASSVQVTCAPRYWSWQGGSNTANARGIYGTRGIAASGNVPGARLGAAVWNGSATQRWMFAGVGVDGNGNTSDLSDLWSYNQNTNQWTWVGGPTTNGDNGTFGAQGVAALGNLPSSRKNSATWTDGAGTLWLFGGYHDNTGNGYLNDLWSYNPSSGLWTWMSGSNTSNGGNASCTNVNSRGVYGVRGVAAAGNSPGARLSPVTWIDGAGNLWLHGGYGCDAAGTLGNLNDLWSYNPGTNQWTWINGSTTIAASGVYGPQGVAATGNVPGGRQSAVSWQDGAGHFWLFGGNGNDSAGTTGNLNDLWLYDPTTNLWEWVSGSTVVNAYGVYGAQGSAPGARDAAQGWIDSAGHLLLFGGNGQASNGSGGWLNDLWSYDSTANQWTWVSGSSTTNVVGTYGSLSVGAAGNVPGARFQSVGWIDAADHLWLFGGYGRDRTTNDGFQPLNDLFDY